MLRSAFLPALLLTATTVTADWPQWQGLERNGKSTDTGP